MATAKSKHDAQGTASAVGQASLREGADFGTALVEAATSRPQERGRWVTAVRCVGRSGRRVCGAYVGVELVAGMIVDWACDRCGRTGVIADFYAGGHDLSRYWRKGKKVVWGVTESQRALLWDVTSRIPSLRALLARAAPAKEVAGLLVVPAAVAELDEMYMLVEDLSDVAWGRRRREALDELRATLCNSMDGF